jgi:hypothetical protein
MQIKCPNCGAAIDEADVNLKAGLASCRACSATLVVTRRGDELITAPADVVAHRAEPASEPEPPYQSGFTVADQDDVLTITFPPPGLKQGWRLLSVGLLAIVFAAMLARDVLVHRPPAFYMFVASAVLLVAVAIGVLVAGLYVTFGVGTVTLKRGEALFARRLFGLTWRARVDVRGVTRVEPFRTRDRTRVELFTCGIVIGDRRVKVFRELGDAEVFRLVEVINGFLKRIHAEDYSSLLSQPTEPPEDEPGEKPGS